MGLVKAFYGHEPLTLICADGTTIRVYPHETEPIAHGRRGPGLRVLVDAPDSVRVVQHQNPSEAGGRSAGAAPVIPEGRPMT